MKRFSCYTCDKCNKALQDFEKVIVTYNKKNKVLHYCSKECYQKHNYKGQQETKNETK